MCKYHCFWGKTLSTSSLGLPPRKSENKRILGSNIREETKVGKMNFRSSL